MEFVCKTMRCPPPPINSSGAAPTARKAPDSRHVTGGKRRTAPCTASGASRQGAGGKVTIPAKAIILRPPSDRPARRPNSRQQAYAAADGTRDAGNGGGRGFRAGGTTKTKKMIDPVRNSNNKSGPSGFRRALQEHETDGPGTASAAGCPHPPTAKARTAGHD